MLSKEIIRCVIGSFFPIHLSLSRYLMCHWKLSLLSKLILQTSRGLFKIKINGSRLKYLYQKLFLLCVCHIKFKGKLLHLNYFTKHAMRLCICLGTFFLWIDYGFNALRVYRDSFILEWMQMDFQMKIFKRASNENF